MTIPSELAIGATVSPLSALLLTSEFDLVFWSSAREIVYEIPGTQDGYVVPQGWDDSYRIALGAEYRLSDIDLRGGFSYDSTPIPDETAHPAYPDADRYGYSVGLGYRVGPGLLLDFAVSAYAFKERTVDDSGLEITDEATGIPGQAFNGTYRTSGTSVSLSVTYLWR
jgi:long-chain fatty acid transport protein